GPRDVARVLPHRRQRRRNSTAWSAIGGSRKRTTAAVESTAYGVNASTSPHRQRRLPTTKTCAPGSAQRSCLWSTNGGRYGASVVMILRAYMRSFHAGELAGGERASHRTCAVALAAASRAE